MERPEYYILTAEKGCVGAVKADALRYGEKKSIFRKQIEHEAEGELKRLILEKLSNEPFILLY